LLYGHDHENIFAVTVLKFIDAVNYTDVPNNLK
jgi:hypothetical protein